MEDKQDNPFSLQYSQYSTIDMLGQLILCWGAVLCIVRHLAPTLVSSRQMLGVPQPPNCDDQTSPDIARCSHGGGWGSFVKCSVENYCFNAIVTFEKNQNTPTSLVTVLIFLKRNKQTKIRYCLQF